MEYIYTLTIASTDWGDRAVIMIKKVEKEELCNFIGYEEISARIEEYENTTTKIYFAAIEGSLILGHAIVEIDESSIPVIHELVIRPEKRDMELEDGLLRTVLNYLWMNAFSSAMIKNENGLEICDIQRFFSVKCKHRVK